jgi:serine/threonine protein phosphatase 1
MTEVGFIGDIHGCLDELRELVNAATARVSRLVFLGDYVNRGPNSREVLDYLVKLAESQECTFLLGHHDEAFRDAVLADGLDRFLRMGGAATVSSYVEQPYGDVGAQLRARISPEHVRFLTTLAPLAQTESYVAAHAIDYLERGLDRDGADDDRFRIFGHAPQAAGVPTVTRAGAFIDTGCGTNPGGRLTCLFWPSLTWIQSGGAS